MSRELLRKLPKVDELLLRPSLADLAARVPRALVVESIREVLDERRQTLLSGQGDEALVGLEGIETSVNEQVAHRLNPNLRSVINATGVVLHTNLGRAPLSQRILAEASTVSAGYSNLEYDLQARRRGSRYVHSAALLAELTGAEDSLVVNNNAAAMVLLLSALASDKEVIVSRGELIEIGGSFRLPDIMRTSGAKLVEVGATNRTHLKDYERAIGAETAMLMKVHQSNFAIVGFTKEVSGSELSELGSKHNLPVCEDLGCGCLVDLRPYGIETITAAGQIAQGLDLVAFSGDKLLGGPQAGIIVGRADLIAKMRSHPLTRALRVDKLTLATLERTLLCYVDGSWQKELPTLQMLTASLDELSARADALATMLQEGLKDRATVRTSDSIGRVGGGSLPQTQLPSRSVDVVLHGLHAVRVDEALRSAPTPIVCRIDDQTLSFDVRTIFDSQFSTISEQLSSIVFS